jgi:hypothetical protein
LVEQTKIPGEVLAPIVIEVFPLNLGHLIDVWLSVGAAYERWIRVVFLIHQRQTECLWVIRKAICGGVRDIGILGRQNNDDLVPHPFHEPEYVRVLVSPGFALGVYDCEAAEFYDIEKNAI